MIIIITIITVMITTIMIITVTITTIMITTITIITVTITTIMIISKNCQGDSRGSGWCGCPKIWPPSNVASCLLCLQVSLLSFGLVFVKVLAQYLASDIDFEISSNCCYSSHCGELLVDLTYCVHQVCIKVRPI